MRIGGVIVTLFFIGLRLHRARAFEESEQNFLEKLNWATNNDGGRFDRLINSNLCDVSNAAAVSDQGALLYRSVFNLIPNENLTNVPVGNWATLCSYFNEDFGFVSKVLDTLENYTRREDFIASMVRVSFAGNYSRCQNRLAILQTMADDLITASGNEENALNLLLQNRVLLLSAPSYFLFNLRDIYKVFLLAYAAATADPYDEFWKHQSPLTKRTWSKILLERRSRVISLIEQQKNFEFFQILNTLNTVELSDLLTTLHTDADRTVDSAFFSSIDWNTVQIRKIVDLSFERFNNSLAPDMSGKFLSRLLPVQMIRAMRARAGAGVGADISSAAADSSQVTISVMSHLRNVDQVSLPQALQLSECFMALLNETLSASSYDVDESDCALIGKLLYSRTCSFLSQLYDRTLDMKTIKYLDSDKYSILQAKYILGRNGLRGVKDYLLNLKGLMAAIPASYYVNLVKTAKRDGSLENHFAHILKYFPSRANKIAAWAALHACKSVMDAARCIESVLENGDNEVVSTMISPLDVRQNVDNIWNLLAIKARNDKKFKLRVAYLPSFVLTELLRKKELVITYARLFNETHPIHLTIMGLDCDILSRIPISDFLPVFEFYNRQRKIYKKEFPKDLQKCARNAFLNYLRTKSNRSAAPLKKQLLQYLDLADIRSIGGYVLTTLPAKSITTSKYRRNIVEEIGRLSLPELMLAAPRCHLVSIASQYLNETATIEQNAAGNVQTEHLVSLGNLTHFLDDDCVRKIDAPALKFALEAELIDTRVCASLAIRKAWAEKLIEAFGPSESWDENTFLKIGDMLIVMEDSSFDVFNETAASRVADLMKSNYKQLVEWIPRRLPFFDVCCIVLPQNERTAYESSVKRLALFYAASIERLLDTIVETPSVENAHTLEQYQYRYQYARSKNDVARPATTHDYLAVSDRDGRALPDATTDAVVELNQITTESETETETETEMETKTETETETETKTETENQAAISVRSSLFSTNGPALMTIEGEATVTGSFTFSSSGREWPTRSENMVASPTTDAAETPETRQVTTVVDIQSRSPLPHVGQNDDDDDKIGIVATTQLSTFASTRNDSDEPTTITIVSDRDDDEDGSVSTYTLKLASTVAYASVSTSTVQASTTADAAVAAAATVTVETATATATATATDTTTSTTTTTVTTTVVDDAPVSTASYLPGTGGARNAAHFDAEATVDVEVESGSGIGIGNENVNETGRREADDVSSSSSSPPPPIDAVLYNEANVHLLEPVLNAVVRELLTANTTEDSTRFQHRSKRDAAGEKSDSADQSRGRRLPNVGCDTLKILDSMSEFIVGSSRVDIRREDAFDCVELLARMDSLSAQRKKTTWSGVASKLSEANSTFVAGKILSAVSVAELANFTYDVRSAGVLELIGSLSDVSHVWSVQDREKLANKILRDNDENNELAKGAQLSVFTRALGKLVCHVSNPTFFRLLKRNDSLSDIWSALDAFAFADCPMDCLKRIANVTVKVYGDPLQWQPSILKMLGPAAAALPTLFHHSNVSRHLSASAFRCLRLSSDNQHLPYFENDANTSTSTSTSTSISLTSSMLLMENDCVRTDNCSFSSSLAGVVLAEDSLQLPAASSSSPSTFSSTNSNSTSTFTASTASTNSTSPANVSRPFELWLLLVVVVMVGFSFGNWLRYDRG